MDGLAPEPNLTIRPEPTPLAPKFNFWLVSTLVLFIALVGALGYFLGVTKNQNNQKTVDIVSQPSTSTSSPFSKQTETLSSTPTLPDPTANWKTYANTSLGFGFKYPDTLTLKEIQSAGPETCADKKPTCIPYQETLTLMVIDSNNQQLFDIIIIQKPKSKSLKEIAQSIQENEGSVYEVMPLESKEITETMIGYQYLRKGLGSVENLLLPFGSDQTKFISVRWLIRSGDNEPENLNQIIPTFKFTN